MAATTNESRPTHRPLKLLSCVVLVIVSAICGCDDKPVTRPTGANDPQGPPVNVPQPNPIVKPSNEVAVPLTNVPVTTTTNK
jgi:hypothetical protein